MVFGEKASKICTPSVPIRAGITISELSFSYGDFAIYENFSLESHRNCVVLKGPSGCGKTTLLRIMFGTLRAECNPNLPRFSTSVLVLQEDALFPWLTGRANISRFIEVDSSIINGHPLFPTVVDFIDTPAYKMSYGQRRAIELFRAILYKPEVIYLDEPFNYLDDKKASAFISTFIDISTSSSSQLVITTHRHDHSLDKNSDVFEYQGEPPFTSLGHVT
uniref:ABC transporter n=1 Tax=Candidatus Kentrum sp. DK TaxID=2126562 RepID=A0A450SFF8_9GAMM|nr:MAG: ABC transporter [Candidatus Kentron sp. DK]